MKRQNILSFLFTCLIGIFPVCFLFSNNVKDVIFHDFVRGIGWALLVSLLFMCFYWLIFRKRKQRVFLLTIISLLLFWNYFAIENLLSRFRKIYYWHIVIVFVYCILFLIVFLWKSKVSETELFIVNAICGISFSVLLLTNSVIAALNINEIKKNQTEINNNISYNHISYNDSNNSLKSINSANVYLFVFDEFSSLDFMKRYYNFDNVDFEEDLTEKGFTLSKSSRYGWAETMYGLNSLLTMQYQYAPSSDYLFSLIDDSPFFRLFEQYGYHTSGHQIPRSQNQKRDIGDDFVEILFNRSVIGKIGIQNSNYKQKYNNYTSFIKDILKRDYSKIEGESVCEMFYLAIPHYPYVFTENGELLDSKYAVEHQNPEPYLGQYKFCCNVMQEISTKIINDDPDSIILFMSDHSMRFMYMYHDRTFPDYGEIFNGVYYQGKELPFELEGLSGPNTLRLLANELLGTQFELIEDPKLMEMNNDIKRE